VKNPVTMKSITLFIFFIFLFLPCTGYTQETAQDYYNSAIALGSKGKTGEARKELEKALKLEPYNSTVKKYLNIISDSNEGKITKELALLLFQATFLGDKNKPDEALVEFNKAIASVPDYDHSYTCRGLIHVDKGMLEEAIADYSKAIELNPKNAEAYNTRGFIRTLRSQHAQALVDFTKAIEIDPELVEAYQNRGIIYMLKDDYEPACADWVQACQLGQCYNLQMAIIEGQCQQRLE